MGTIFVSKSYEKILVNFYINLYKRRSEITNFLSGNSPECYKLYHDQAGNIMFFKPRGVHQKVIP